MLMIIGNDGFMKTNKLINKTPWLLIAGICLLCLRASSVFSEQIIINSDGQFDFAYNCMEKGEYSRAVGEFERFIYFFPENSRLNAAHFLIGICYLKSKRYEDARDTFFMIIQSEYDVQIKGKSLFMIAESYYQQGVIKEAEYYFTEVIKECPVNELRNAALYRLGWARMQEDKWQEATEFFSMVKKDSLFYGSSIELAEQGLKGETLSYKSPSAAGSLAAVLPGLGHVYLSRYQDATVAFLVNGLFLWAIIESFNNEHDVLGGALCLLELGWYSGNIYSAVNSAHKYNRNVRNDFRKGLKDRLNLRLFTEGGNNVGLSLQFTF